MIESVEDFLARLKQRDPAQPEFHQAVEEVLRSLWPFLEANPHYLQAGILERMVEPERAILFRVSWVYNSESSMYVDGVRNATSQNREMFAVEQVEVTKGSASAMGGAGS
ncbi:MAG: glutamate dehydrogenase, partial [Pseudomonas sp.]